MSDDLENKKESTGPDSGESLESEVNRVLAPEKGARAAKIVWAVLILVAVFAAGAFLKDPILGLLKGLEKKETAKVGTAAAAGTHRERLTGKAACKGKKILFYRAPMNPKYTSPKPGKSPMGMDLIPVCEGKVIPTASTHRERLTGRAACKGKKILFYRAPMNPKYTSPTPGKSPMGMDLIPVCEGKGTVPAGGIYIDPRIRQDMGIRTSPVEKGPVVKNLRIVGNVDYDEKRLAILNTKIGGWVEKLYVDYTGQRVKKGRRLLTLYSPLLVSTQQELLLAYRRYQRTKAPRNKILWQAAQERLSYWDITPGQIRRLERTGKVSRDLTVYAPFNGVVVNKLVVEGQHIKAGASMFDIADLSKVWVYLHVYEMDVPFVKVGQKVDVTLSYDPGAKIPTGRVDYLYPWLNVKARDVKARVIFDNRSGYLKPGMYVTATVHVNLGRDALLVDDLAVLRSGLRNVVYVETGPGTYEPRSIKLGVQMDNRVEVLSGLKEGEKVVTDGQFMLDSESQLNGVTTMPEQGKDNGKMTEPKGKGKVMSPREALKSLLAKGCKYTCPMPPHFHVCRKGPGKCPECGMKLQPIVKLLKRYESKL